MGIRHSHLKTCPVFSEIPQNFLSSHPVTFKSFQMEHVVIIGNGIAGITAARYIRKMSDAAITVISAESKHFFSRTALMYVYMGHMNFKDIKPYEDWFWEKNRITLVQSWVSKVDTGAKKISLSHGKDFVSYILDK